MYVYSHDRAKIAERIDQAIEMIEASPQLTTPGLSPILLGILNDGGRLERPYEEGIGTYKTVRAVYDSLQVAMEKHTECSTAPNRAGVLQTLREQRQTLRE